MNVKMSEVLFKCNASMQNNRHCNKKYKTKSGIEKHYDTVHKEEMLKSNKMSNFTSYMKSFVTYHETETKDKIPPEQNPEQSNASFSIQSLKDSLSIQEIQSLQGKIKFLESQNKFLSSQHKIYEMKQKDMSKRLKKLERATKKYCIVCWENESNYALVPCGHKIVCGTCAFSVLSGTKTCPVCANEVFDLLQVWDRGQPASDEEESE